MNKYDMTLRQINHDKPLLDYDPGHHVSKYMNQCERIYSQKVLNDYKEDDLILMLNEKIQAEELVELALDIISHRLNSHGHTIPVGLLKAIAIQDMSYWKSHPEQEKTLVKSIKIYDERLSLVKYHMNLIDLDTYRNIEKSAQEIR